MSHRPRPTIPEDDDDEEEEEDGVDDRGPIYSSPQWRPPQSRRSVQRPATVPAKPPERPSTLPPVERPTVQKTMPKSPRVRLHVEKSAGGENFTHEETELLLDAYDDVLNLREDKVIDAWITWATAVFILIISASRLFADVVTV